VRSKIKGIDSTGAPLVHVPGWMYGWMGGWVGGSKSGFKDCLQQSIKPILYFYIKRDKVFFVKYENGTNTQKSFEPLL
jgi:hypothetical protein